MFIKRLKSRLPSSSIIDGDGGGGVSRGWCEVSTPINCWMLYIRLSVTDHHLSSFLPQRKGGKGRAERREG